MCYTPVGAAPKVDHDGDIAETYPVPRLAMMADNWWQMQLKNKNCTSLIVHIYSCVVEIL